MKVKVKRERKRESKRVVAALALSSQHSEKFMHHEKLLMLTGQLLSSKGGQ